MNLSRLLVVIIALGLLGSAPLPRFDHIVVIVDENKDLASVVGRSYAPTLTSLAHAYGYATHYDAVAHPSEPNYVALVGGDTFGIHDDGGPLKNTVDAPNLGSQFDAAHLTWRGYYEGLPKAGSLAPYAGRYAFKHSGFLNYRSVQSDPHRAAHIVGFDRFERDVANDALPNFSLVVPDLCNDMHGVGLTGACSTLQWSALIRRGDDTVKRITGEIMATPMWKSSQRCAIAIVFDEDDSGSTEGGGGRVPAVVITNHGPRGVVDATPYTHYSLLRTIEDAFGLAHLGHAADATTVPMTKLFVAE